MADNEEAQAADADSDVARFWNEAADATDAKPESNDPAKVETAEPESKETLRGDKNEPAPDADAAGKEEEGEGEEGEAGEEQTDGEESAPDPWESAPEELRLERESLIKERDEFLEKSKKYEHDARSNRGRLAALEKKFKELSQKSEEIPTKDEKGKPEVDPLASIFDTPDWKQFEENFGADVAGPQKAAMGRLFEAMHARIKAIESKARNLEEFSETQKSTNQVARLQDLFSSWNPDFEREDDKTPAWFSYIKQNYDDLEAFVDENDSEQTPWKTVWAKNSERITDANAVNSLLSLFHARKMLSQQATSKKAKPASSANGKDEAQPKPKPRELTDKRKKQLESAAGAAPRSAPGPGSRSSDLPDPDDWKQAFDYFASKATR